jgi:hypothetical protein
MKRLLHPVTLWLVAVLLWIGIAAIYVTNPADATDIQGLRRDSREIHAALEIDRSVQLIAAGLDPDQPRQRAAFQRILEWSHKKSKGRMASENAPHLAGNGLYIVHFGHHPTNDAICDASVIFLMTYSGNRCVDAIVHDAKPNQYYTLQYFDRDHDGLSEILSLPFDDISEPGPQDGGVSYRITDRGFVKM